MLVVEDGSFSAVPSCHGIHRPMGPEVRPLLGEASDVAGLAIGNGLGAAGLTIGPFVGRMLADVALGRAPALDLAPFDLLRIPTPAQDVPSTLR